MSRRASRVRDDLAGEAHASAGTIRLRPEGSDTAAVGANLHDHVLGLQRSYGNTAVRTLVVQRRDRPQSTDAPGAKKKAPVKKKEAAPEDYAPTGPNPRFQTWATADLSERAAQESDSTVKNSWYFAAELYEEYWFRTKNRAVGIYLSRVYGKLGDDKRKAYWMAVAQGTIKPGKQSTDEDMSDKAF